MQSTETTLALDTWGAHAWDPESRQCACGRWFDAVNNNGHVEHRMEQALTAARRSEAQAIARLEVTRGELTEYPLAEKVKGGWQNGATFYPESDVTKVTYLQVSLANQNKSSCICGPASITSDGPNVDCPQHGLGNVGGCHNCWGSGVIEDCDGGRPCSACDGTGTPIERRGDDDA